MWPLPTTADGTRSGRRNDSITNLANPIRLPKQSKKAFAFKQTRNWQLNQMVNFSLANKLTLVLQLTRPKSMVWCIWVYLSMTTYSGHSLRNGWTPLAESKCSKRNLR